MHTQPSHYPIVPAHEAPISSAQRPTESFSTKADPGKTPIIMQSVVLDHPNPKQNTRGTKSGHAVPDSSIAPPQVCVTIACDDEPRILLPPNH